MKGSGKMYYSKTNIRHNEKTFKIGHAFSKKELDGFKNEELERLIKVKAITTNRGEVSRVLEVAAEREKQFQVTRESYDRRDYRP